MFLTTCGAWAQAPGAGTAAKCPSMADDAARLACYDAAFGRPKAESLPPHAAAMTQDTPPPADLAKFGDEGQLKRDRQAKSALPKTLTGRISQLTRLHDGLYRLTLDNQQSWQTTGSDWVLEFNTGDRVTITRLPLGGYQLAPEGEARSVGVRRIQ